MASVNSKIETTYKFKDGRYVTVIRYTKDLFHPVNGGIINRTTEKLDVFGNLEMKHIKEFKEWLERGCKPPLPKALKKYIEENHHIDIPEKTHE